VTPDWTIVAALDRTSKGDSITELSISPNSATNKPFLFNFSDYSNKTASEIKLLNK
jgi:hypothetical protein